MSYPEVIKYLESLIDYERFPDWGYKDSLDLHRFRGFLAALGDVQKSLRCIHVAGSKGKGSTCAFIAYILRQAGYKVGLYTSPHLSDFRERIRVLTPGPRSKTGRPEFEGMISRQALCRLVEGLKPAITNYNRTTSFGPLTYFEVITALAFWYFCQQQVDFAVLETGLGGRLDATNAACALVSVITPISLEHTQKLGNTLAAIAAEKAGIIKASGTFVVSAAQEKPAAAVIQRKCRQVGARLHVVGKDIVCSQGQSRQFEVQAGLRRYADLKLGLIGQHQIANACAAVAAVDALGHFGVKVSIESVRQGLYTTVWPGRCEVLSRGPTVVLDGAQNAASSRILCAALSGYFTYRKLILVLGVSSDKDIRGICRALYPLASLVILTRASSPRAASCQVIAEAIAAEFPGQAHPPVITDTVNAALRQALKAAGKKDLVLVTGSLFVVGEARRILRLEAGYGTKKRL